MALNVINERDIETTRGDGLPLTIINENPLDKTLYSFQVGDIVRFKICEKNNMDNVLLEEDFKVEEECQEFDIFIPGSRMVIGPIINQPVDYWYEIELNPDTDNRDTIMAYENDLGAPVLTLLPEGGRKNVDKN